ncbi:MAG: hypothetical protein IH600_02855 [Bacteroidetes bacterium]|nr:hypothetical protein [Bacteroidota bacterium]
MSVTKEPYLPIKPYDASALFHGGQDIYIAVWTLHYREFVGALYIGGGGDDWVSDVKYDGEETLYLCGQSDSNDFPTSSGSPQPYNAGMSDAIIFALDLNTLRINWSTYFGGPGADGAESIDYDSYYGVIVGGSTASPSLPVTTNAIQKENRASTRTGFVVLYDMNMQRSYCSFLGGEENDAIYKVILDHHRLYCVGRTSSETIFTTTSASSRYFNGIWDVFIVVLDCESWDIEYASYFGGQKDDYITDVFVKDNYLYLIGETSSSNFPITHNAYQNILNNQVGGSQYDWYISIISTESWQTHYSSFYGGSKDERMDAAVLSREGIVIIGRSNSYDSDGVDGKYTGMYIDKMECAVLISWKDYTVDGFLKLYSGNNSVAFCARNCGESVYYCGWTSSNDIYTSNDAMQKTKEGMHAGVLGILVWNSGVSQIVEFNSWNATTNIYPTIANNYVTIENKATADIMCVFVNLESGKAVDDVVVRQESSKTICISRFSEGIYGIFISDGVAFDNRKHIIAVRK